MSKAEGMAETASEQPVDTAGSDEGKTDAQLWAEMDAKEGITAAAEGDEQPVKEDEAAAADAATASNAGDGGEAAGKPAAEPDGQQQNTGAAGASGDGKGPSAEAAAKAQSQETDIWANATAEQKAELEKLRQSERSNRNRVSALNRKLSEHRRAIAQPSKDAATAASGAAGTGNAGDEDPGLKALRAEYPEVAEPILKEMAKRDKEIAELKGRFAALDEERLDADLDEQERLLEQEHPEWRKLVFAADSGFGKWLEDQPRHIQLAAQDNADSIVDAREAADVIGRFKAFRSTQGGNAQQQGNTGTTALSPRRQRQLESSESARSKGPGPASGIPPDGDPQAIWDGFEELDRRKAARA